MKNTPFHIHALRAGAIVLAVGAGSYLVLSTQRAANPEPAQGALQSQENPRAEDGLVQGNPFPTPGDGKPTFIYGSKSFVPEADVLSENPVENAEAKLPELTNRTFMHSSKSLSLPAPRPEPFFHSSKNSVTVELPEIAFPIAGKDQAVESATPASQGKKAAESAPKQ